MQIPVRRVDFDDVEAGVEGAAGRGGKRRDDRRDVGGRQRARARDRRLKMARPWARRPAIRPPLPARARIGPSHGTDVLPFLPGVRKLDGRGASLRSDETYDPGETVDVPVAPDPEIRRS